MNLETLLKTASNQGTKSVLKTSTRFFLLTLGSLLLSLVSLVLVSLTLLTKWLLVITICTVGKLRTLVQKTNQYISTRTN